MTKMTFQPPHLRILIINPNTSTNMTTALEPAIQSLGYTAQNIKFTYYTCPSSPSNPGIPSINSPADALASTTACLPSLIPLLESHDAFLVACYSAHPLVTQLTLQLEARASNNKSAGSNDDVPRRKPVQGIFEASVAASLSLIGPTGPAASFGIVSTGKIWETALETAVREFMGPGPRFVGCETTGLNASELHEMPADQVRGRMMEATKRLVRRARERGTMLRAVCLGCAGMVGLEEAVRAALTEEMGAEGGRVAVVDGVKAGVGELVMLSRGGF